MVDFITKQVLLLIEPVGLLWVSLIVLSVLLFRKKMRWLGVFTSLLVAGMTLCGGTDFPGWLLRNLERPWAGMKIESLPVCDAVVLLGGGAEPARFEMSGVHLTKGGDRVMMALELMRQGKAPVLCLGGGGAEFDGTVVSEAERVAAWFSAWNLPTNAEVVSFGVNRNTRDEAEKTAALVKSRGWKRVILVTSAFHMKRAAATFRKVGVDIVPAPCNFLTTISTSDGPWDVNVPSWSGCEKISIWMHEIIGWQMYRRRGWIAE
jgi:uncharacterized SAM-binding protein YcdF (DUF218 family)